MKNRKSVRLLSKAQKILDLMQNILDEDKNPKSQFAQQSIEVKRSLCKAMDEMDVFIDNID